MTIKLPHHVDANAIQLLVAKRVDQIDAESMSFNELLGVIFNAVIEETCDEVNRKLDELYRRGH